MKLIVLLLSLYSLSAYAKDLGVWGPRFQISEPNLLDQIESKINVYQKNGELERFHQRYLDEFKKQVIKPNKIIGISKVVKEQYRKLDPTTELEEDIRIDQELLYAKGTKINPLDYMLFDEPLIFIDGEDIEQVKFAHGYYDKNPKSRIILINGEPGLKEIEQQEYYYYFDQWGAYSSRFSIVHVPSLVYQENNQKVLTIWEVKLP